jgi:nucleotide-binding universal stress UspA family protein
MACFPTWAPFDKTTCTGRTLTATRRGAATRGADGSEDAQRAIKTAIGLSTKLEPELHIIYVAPELIHTIVVVQKQYLLTESLNTSFC